MNRLSLLPILLLAGCVANAGDEPWTVNAYFENDLFSETDQNYTNGIRLSWVSPDISSYETDPRLPNWVREVNDKLDFFHDSNKGLARNLVISVGQLMYTPSSIDAEELLEDERPYAGYLYMGFAYHTRSDSQLDTVEVNLGMVGPEAQGEQTQDLIHKIRAFDKFQGWDNQLKNEPALQLVYEHKRRLFKDLLLPQGLFASGKLSTVEQDFIAHGGVSLGNVATYVNFGGEYRIGYLPDDFGTSAVRPGGDNSAPGRGDPRRRRGNFPIFGLHGFVALDTRLVVRDIFLDGNTFRDSHSVDKEPVVADISTGVSFLTGHWKVSYAYVVRTREFQKQPHHHQYGSLSLSYSW